MITRELPSGLVIASFGLPEPPPPPEPLRAPSDRKPTCPACGKPAIDWAYKSDYYRVICDDDCDTSSIRYASPGTILHDGAYVGGDGYPRFTNVNFGDDCEVFSRVTGQNPSNPRPPKKPEDMTMFDRFLVRCLKETL